MSQDMGSPRESPEVRSEDDLIEYFHAGAKAPEAWKIGVEYEKPVVFASNGEAVPYAGSNGIGAVLERMRDFSGWEGIHEGENLIALHDGLASITLEPGGQLEMSGQQCESLHCANEELSRHIDELVEVGGALDLAFLGLGITPKTPLEHMPWMPKERYRIMRAVMERTGHLGHFMMQQTACVQANFDYSDERDARRKFRVAMAASPILIAVAANSPIAAGKPTGYRSYRAHIWRDTDPARCGILPFAFDTDDLFVAYTRYALDVPMYFVSRAGRLIDVQGKTFRHFLDHGIEGERPTLADWTTHLTTLFPEARLKTYIEVRAPDSQPSDLVLATPAMMKGLLYDSDCLDAAWDVLSRWSIAERSELGEAAAREALGARAGRYRLLDYARELVNIAREGLSRQARLDADGRDESIYLERMADDVDRGLSPADRIIEHWENDWAGSLDRLVHYTAYRRA
jgi:glutamate--cysteine ligase